VSEGHFHIAFIPKFKLTAEQVKIFSLGLRNEIWGIEISIEVFCRIDVNREMVARQNEEMISVLLAKAAGEREHSQRNKYFNPL